MANRRSDAGMPTAVNPGWPVAETDRRGSWRADATPVGIRSFSSQPESQLRLDMTVQRVVMAAGMLDATGRVPLNLRVIADN
jgi:hypothetical protein